MVRVVQALFCLFICIDHLLEELWYTWIIQQHVMLVIREHKLIRNIAYEKSERHKVAIVLMEAMDMGRRSVRGG